MWYLLADLSFSTQLLHIVCSLMPGWDAVVSGSLWYLNGILTLLKQESWLCTSLLEAETQLVTCTCILHGFWGGSEVWGHILKTGISVPSQEGPSCRRKQIMYRCCTLTVSLGAAVPAGSWCEANRAGSATRPLSDSQKWEATSAFFWLVMLLTGKRRCFQNVSGSCKSWM